MRNYDYPYVEYVKRLPFILTLLCTALLSLLTDAFCSEPDNSASLPLAITPRIIGGTTAIPGAWPWMVALIGSDSKDYYSGQFCGGALVAETWVLTAAHCVYDEYFDSWDDPREVDVVLGLHNLKTDLGDRISVKRIVGHPQYNPLTLDSDIALLELEQPSSREALPLFFDDTSDLSGNQAIVIGWGDTSQSNYSDYPDELQQVNVPVVGNLTCETVHPGDITDNMLCAGYAEGGKDSCFGDSGGPLMVNLQNRWNHAGIISWGNGCALPSSYGVHTRTSRFYEFITSYTTPSPEIQIDPETIQFGYVSLGATLDHTVWVRNLGQSNLVIGSIGNKDPLEPPFAITADMCSGTTLAPSEQCSLVVSYTPKILLDYHVSFDIPSNDPVQSSSTVYITASGQFPWFLFVPAITNGQHL